MKKINTFKGQSMFEVLLALGIMALVTVAIVSVSTISIRNNIVAKNKTLANKYVNEVNEWLRMRRDENFNSFQAHGRGNAQNKKWCASTLPTQPNAWFGNSGGCSEGSYIPGTSFYREVFLETSGGGSQTTVKSSAYVFWTDSQGTHEVRSSTYYTDWQ